MAVFVSYVGTHKAQASDLMSRLESEDITIFDHDNTSKCQFFNLNVYIINCISWLVIIGLNLHCLADISENGGKEIHTDY